MHFILDKIRGIAYRLGYRPAYRTLLYSPSRDLMYAVKDVKIYEAFRKGYDKPVKVYDFPKKVNAETIPEILEVLKRIEELKDSTKEKRLTELFQLLDEAEGNGDMHE